MAQPNLLDEYLRQNPDVDPTTIAFVPQEAGKSHKEMVFGSSSCNQKFMVSEAVGRRRGTLNWIPFIIGMTLPWLLFTCSLGMNGFRPRDWFPLLVDGFNLFALVTAGLYIASTRQKRQPYDVKFVIGLLCFIYLCMGWVMGSILYWFFMQPFYTLSGMATYHGVNPSRFKKLVMTPKTNQIGEQGYSSVSESEQYNFALQDAGHPTFAKRYQDAGTVYFDSPTITVDKSKVMSYKEGDLYCVAPIIDTACTSDCGFEFWAVGLNCCGTDGELAFTCDGHDWQNGLLDGSTYSVSAYPLRSAVRWIEPLAMNFFRLAVSEAEGVHNVQSPRPAFFKFYNKGEDPAQEVANLARAAYRRLFLYSMMSFFTNIVFMGFLAKKLIFGPKGGVRRDIT